MRRGCLGASCSRSALPVRRSSRRLPRRSKRMTTRWPATRRACASSSISTREPDPKWFLLRGPHRLVIDLPKTKFAIDPKELKARGLVKNVRYGHINDRHLAPDPRGQGAVRRRKARHSAERRLARLPHGGGYLGGLAERIRRCARRAGADHRLDAGDAEERAPGPADRPRRPALHHRHRSRPWRDRRRRGGTERHGREGHHADLCRRNCATGCAPTAATTSS